MMIETEDKTLASRDLLSHLAVINNSLEQIADRNPDLFKAGYDRDNVEIRYKQLINEAGKIEEELGR